MAMIRAAARPATRPEPAQFCGDLLVRFPAAGAAGPGRSGSAWEVGAKDRDWELSIQPPGPDWRGFPSSFFELEGWRVWLFGEIHGAGGDDAARQLLAEVVTGVRTAADLNGHFLLAAWSAETREWHIWTDRFGTLHAYHAASGGRAAFGTFFPSVSGFASARSLDWRALTGFFGLGFFPGDRTFFEGVRVLRPASHFVVGSDGRLLREERYWKWRFDPDRRRSYDDTVAEFADVLGRVLEDQTRQGRIAVPISGGLDSRTTVADLTQPGRAAANDSRLWFYSYGYSEDSVETRIAGRIARARNLPFQPITIRPYLFQRLGSVLASVEGFADLTQCRQAAISEELRSHSDYVIGAHFGDVWLGDQGLAGREAPPGEEEILQHVLPKVQKSGRDWLLENLCRPRLPGEDSGSLLSDFLRAELARLRDLEDPDFRLKALKAEQWSFRWTLPSVRMFQAGAFPRLPFYDTRLSDFFATVPSELVAGRRLQIDYLKRFAPDLARVTWQKYGVNLFRYRYIDSLLLPERAIRKLWRKTTRHRPLERNWEVQLLGDDGRRGLNDTLLRPGLRVHELVARERIETLLRDFFAEPGVKGRGYTVSMLLTFSAWLERFG